MGNQATAAGLTEHLARNHRVIILGGLAVISHGHSRSTYDSDVWLDASLPVSAWCAAVEEMVALSPQAKVVCIGSWRTIGPGELPSVIVRDKVVRVTGLNQPLDIFREPNQLEVETFDEVWARAKALEDGTRLPDVIDLLVTKQMTGRDKDFDDITFLERQAEADYLARLPNSTASVAEAMLARFLTPKVAQCALDHPDASVREMGRGFLEELSADGDPYAAEILRLRFSGA